MAGLVLLALVLAVALYRTDDREVITPPAPSPGQTRSPADLTRADGAAQLLLDLTEALDDGSRAEVLSLAAPGEPIARKALATIHANVSALGVDDISLRFVDEEAGGVPPALGRELGESAWVGDVVLGWRLRGFDPGPSSLETSLVFVDTPDGVAFGAPDDDETAPLWLLERLAVARSGRALVATTDQRQLGRYARLADHAVRDVRSVLPRWRGRLVVEVPASREQLDQVLGAEPGTYTAIAAVTATVDGSTRRSAPVHILVNPDVFAELGSDGSQIVMSHEATHVAMRAATSTMPLWLLEGFADYVALARADLPVEVTASQILERVRRTGPPRTLPRGRDFDPSNKILGTSYEAAWLASRLLAEVYGERGLVRFYDTVDAGAST
ncbi:MAG: hypothetical protein ACRDPR_07285, partial [Nocardioidaceae bacterium]